VYYDTPETLSQHKQANHASGLSGDMELTEHNASKEKKTKKRAAAAELSQYIDLTDPRLNKVEMKPDHHYASLSDVEQRIPDHYAQYDGIQERQ